MVNDKTAPLVLVLGIAGIFGLLHLTRAKSPESARIAISISPVELAPEALPGSIPEGGSAVIDVSVTNLTTKGGVPWDATLTVEVYVSAGITWLPGLGPLSEAFGPGQTRSWSIPVDVPIGLGGEMLVASGLVSDINGILIASGSKQSLITTVNPSYAASMTVS